MKIERSEVYMLEIPFKRKFKHAESERKKTENLVTKITLENGITGFGEGVPREYVTGEIPSTSAKKLIEYYLPKLDDLNISDFGECVNFLSGQEELIEGDTIYNSAKCSLELALLDAYGKHFGKSVSAIADVLKIKKVPFDEKVPQRFSYVFSMDEKINRLKTNALFFYGFKNFKFKINEENDFSQIDRFIEIMKSKINSLDISMMVDANGSLYERDLDKLINELDNRRIYFLEQPLRKGKEKSLKKFKEQYVIVLDESLCSLNDAQRAVDEKYGDMFNIRISKNGGIINSLKIREIARNNRISYQLGCMVGETGILSAAGRHFAQMSPETMFYEGSYGTHLLVEDITREKMTFGIGAEVNPKRHPLGNFGLGINVDEERLSKYSKKIEF